MNFSFITGRPLWQNILAGMGISILLVGVFLLTLNIITKYWFDKERENLPADKKTTFAVLVRSRSQIDLIQSAFGELNIPTDVVGVGGLINTPEIADIIALLRTLTMPESGTALMRLLTGPHLNLGARDLMALGSFTKSFARANDYSRGAQLKQALEESIEIVATADEFAAGSIIESLEQLLTLTEVELKDYRATPAFTDEGLARLRKFALSLRSLRRNLNGSITEAIIEVCEFLSLDTEVLVRDGWQNGARVESNSRVSTLPSPRRR